MDDAEPQISNLEAILLLAYVGILDLIGIIILLFGGDDFFILDLLSFPVTQFYLRIKKVDSAGIDLGASLAELFPWLGGFPIKSAGIAFVIYADRHPNSWIAKKTRKAAAVTSVAQGKAPSGGPTQKFRSIKGNAGSNTFKKAA